MSPRHAHGPVWQRQVLRWASPFPGNSILNGVDEILPVCDVTFYSVCQVLHYYILKEVSLECFPIYLVFAYVWMLGGAYLWRSGDNLWESSLSYHVGPVDQTEASLGDKHSHPLGTSPALIFFCTAFISGYLFLSLELTLHVYWLIWLPLSSPCFGHSY